MISMEQLLIKAAKNEEFETEMAIVQKSCFSKDISISELSKQLPLLHDMVKNSLPSVKSITSLHTICDAMNTNEIFKEMFSSVHLMLRLILTSPITSATAERSFSALKDLNTYDGSTMTEKWLNNCLLLNIHKDITDSCKLNAAPPPNRQGGPLPLSPRGPLHAHHTACSVSVFCAALSAIGYS